jgi:hypothetical protein
MMDVAEPRHGAKKAKKGAAEPASVPTIDDADERAMVMNLYAYQAPHASQWSRPFLRLVSNHRYNEQTRTLKVRYYLYFTRLIFELIADPTIKVLACVGVATPGTRLAFPLAPLTTTTTRTCPAQTLMAATTKPYTVVPVRQRPPQPVMFRSTGTALYENNLRYKFSLPGMLKRAEVRQNTSRVGCVVSPRCT